MKFDKNKAFPYPVLRPYNDDFVDREFQATADFEIEANTVTAEISYALSSEDIAELIKNNQAIYVSVISCRDTYFSVSIQTTEKQIRKEFDNGLFRGQVEIKSYILIIKELPLTSKEVHPDFGSGPFQYTKGDVIAQDETAVFYFDRDVFKPVSSVFDLVKREGLSGGSWELRYDQDHVQIEVSPAMKESIDGARNSPVNKVILVNSILFAAVMQSIEKIREGDGVYDDYKWATIIKQSAHNNSIDIMSHDSYYVAEKLMQHPLSMLDAYVFKKGAE